MKVTLHQLKIFRVVAEQGSITRAAERLHLTPPTLSIQLRQLAEGLGVTLYEIIGRQLRLTGAGEDVLHSARNLEAELHALDQRLAARGGVERGRLRVAAVSTGEYLFPSMLGRFRQRHPGIEASLQIMPRDALIRRIDQGLDDWYLMTRPPEDRDLVIERVAINPLVMIAAPDHPWTRRKRIDFRAVSNERFVVREPGSGTRLWTEEWLGRFGAELKPALELGSNEAIKQTRQQRSDQAGRARRPRPGGDLASRGATGTGSRTAGAAKGAALPGTGLVAPRPAPGRRRQSSGKGLRQSARCGAPAP